MCLTIPGLVVTVNGEHATVDYGSFGMRRNASVLMVRAEVGDYVLVQGGFIIKILQPKEAKEALKVWELVRHQMDDDTDAAT